MLKKQKIDNEKKEFSNEEKKWVVLCYWNRDLERLLDNLHVLLSEKQIYYPYYKIKKFNYKLHKFEIKHRVFYSGYLFLNVDKKDLQKLYLESLINCIFLEVERKIVFVSESEIEEMKKIEQRKQDEFDGGDVYDCFKIGQEVEIIHGAFENFKGKILSINYNKAKAVVETSVCLRDIPVDIPFEYLKR